MAKKLAVKKAIEAIDSGDARGLRKHINEALVAKVRKALDVKEKKIARNLIEAKTSNKSAEDKLTRKIRITGKELYYEKFITRDNDFKTKEIEKEITSYTAKLPSSLMQGEHLLALFKFQKARGATKKQFANEILQMYEYGLASMPSPEVKQLKKSGYSDDDIIQVILNMPELA